MNVVFLDIDGVLNVDDHYISLVMENENCGTKNIVRDEFGHVFSPSAVRWLGILVEKFGLKIVISSDWRYSGLEWCQNLWKTRNLPGEVVGITPIPTRALRSRGQEIRIFLDTHPEIENYVIMDDNFDFLPEQTCHTVIVDETCGINYDCYRAAKDILTSPENRLK